MKARTADTPSFEELTTAGPESTDPAYLAWRDEQVRVALAADIAHPERRISQAKVWKKFGLES